MDKDFKISLLFDFYKPILTDKQIEAVELYYNQDLSLAEISEHTGITRQGVRDCIKKGERTLLDMENRLKLAHKFMKFTEKADEAKQLITQIGVLNKKRIFNREIADLATKAMNTLDEVISLESE